MNGLEYTKAIAISGVPNLEQREDLIKSAFAGFSLVEIKKQVKVLLSLASEVEQSSEDNVTATQEASTNESVISDRLPDRQQRVTSFLQKAKSDGNFARWSEVDDLLAQLENLLS